VEISKEKNKISFCSELPKIAMLPKEKHFGPLGVNRKGFNP